jgi:signal transduction histidine kinase
VEQMGGDVEVSSVVNQGSIFTINFSVMCLVQQPEDLIN